MKRKLNEPWLTFLELAALMAFSAAAAVLFYSQFRLDPEPAVVELPPPASDLVTVYAEQDLTRLAQGWNPESVEQMASWRESLERFAICSKDTGEPVFQDNVRANVRLWKLTALQVGQPPPNGPQLTGDCTSWSSAHAIEGTQSGQMAAGELGEWKRIFPTFNYAAGRVWIWRKEILGPLPGEGCSVSAVLRSAHEYGVITWDQAEAAGYKYSGKLADDWGRNGPPEALKAIAAAHRVKSVSQMKSAADVRDAICNGYGVACGSDMTPGNFRPLDGRIVADNHAPRMGMRQRWHHALCIDGYDGTAASGPKYHIQNSWYPESHPAPIDDSPVCGFWVDESTIEYMVKQDDCFAVAGFDGFVERRNEVDLFQAADIERVGRSVSLTRKTLVSP